MMVDEPEIQVYFENGISSETSEKVEDLIKDALNKSREVNVRGSVESNVTGNSATVNPKGGVVEHE